MQVVGDVAQAFSDLVRAAAPRSIALSGGSTARRCYEALADVDALDWPTVTVVFGDERWVPVDDEDSNERLARESLVDHVEVGRVLSARGAGETIEAAADAYDATIAGLPALDLVHLGLGEDGHTASLFPGSPALEVTDRLVVATGDDDHPHPRLTLTFPAIARARLAVVTVSGASKADAWRAVQEGEDLPAARLEAERLVWLVDLAAAGTLP